MQYRKDKYGNDISILGYGCMRFSSTAGRIDLDKAEKEILCAINAGVNYFDTAYIYPGNETALGEILARNNLREKVYIATKLPHYMVKNASDFDRIFNEEKKRLKTNYVDYYLMHMLSDIHSWERLIEFGVLDWLKQKQEAGEIRQVGFSYHGNSDMFVQILNAYDWDFTQIQYNYYDETSQAGRHGLYAAYEKGIPVVIMEPLRGGRLIQGLPKNAVKRIEDFPVKRTPAHWGLAWLYDQKEVSVVLSGMNSLEMVEENCRIASESTPGYLTDKERQLYKDLVSDINKNLKVGCTGCRYCMPCPKNVDIPGTFSAYNEKYSVGWVSGMREYFMCTALRKTYTGASNCVGCGLCEKHCPQGIAIREELKNAKKSLENPVYKIGRKIIPLFMKY